MFNPDVVAKLRAAIRAGDAVNRFDGYPVRRSPVIAAAAEDAEIIGSEEPWAAEMAAPAAIFGRPADDTCLNGVGAAVRHVPRKTLYEVRNASIIGNNVVLAEGGRLYGPSPAAAPACLERLASANAKNHHGFVIESMDGKLAAYYAAREAPLRLGQKALFLHNLEAGNYGSFLFRQRPQILFARNFSFDFDVYVVPSRTSWLNEALRLAGMPRRPVYTVREVSGDCFSSVIFCDEFDAEGFLSATTVAGLRTLADEAAQAALPDGGRRPCEKLYVSRALCSISRPTYRPLTNEREIEASFAERGFPVCHPETMTFEEQIALFRGARRIAGPSGSGMLNAAFAPSRSKVLDLESFTFTVRQHAKIYASSHKDYAFLFGDLDEGDERPLMLRRWRIPRELCDAAMDWLLS